jgi:hypothetical protein
MSLRTLSSSLVGLALVVGGCANNDRQTIYTGPAHSGQEVAHLPYFEAQRDIRIVSVDGKRVANPKANIELAAGTRTIEIIYTPPKTSHSYPVRLTFHAEAGHSYALSAKVLGGKDAGQGFWEGKYQAFVYDMSPVHEVARSEGPMEEKPANHG